MRPLLLVVMAAWVWIPLAVLAARGGSPAGLAAPTAPAIGWRSIVAGLGAMPDVHHGLLGASQAGRSQDQPSRAPLDRSPDDRAVLNQYRVTCHNQRIKTAGLTLDTLNLANVAGDAELWEKVVRKLRAGAMPPPGLPRPGEALVRGLIARLETSLDRAALATPNPGSVTIHRLNRAEYANAIRDLLALEIDTASLLPADDSTYGFDNIADVLGVSPVLLERYLTAAEKISALAVGDGTAPPVDETYRVRADLTQTGHRDGLPLGTRGGVLIRHTFPLDGEYVIKAKLWKTNVNVVRGLAFPHDLEFTVDGERVHLVTIGGPVDSAASAENSTDAGAEVEARLQVRVRVKAGPRAVGVAFVQKTAALPPQVMQPFESTLDPVDGSGVPKVEAVIVGGPFNPTGPGDTPSRRRIFVCRPATHDREVPCATTIISTLARRAYRRPITEADVQLLLGFYQTGRTKGSFETGIEMAVRRILASPEFAFRIERDPARVPPGHLYRISDVELASRLSFFLWSSIPDDRLLQLASEGRLRDPAVLEQQVRRMLADDRAEALVNNFAGQWLYLRNLRSVTPDVLEFPDFDDNLRQAFQHETELFFGSIMREDRNVLDLMTADYTFVNERLAKHYGLPNIYGSHFRRVTLTDEARKGLLGKGSILTVTSYANRTSPVLRGKWILENLLGTPPPPPPPNVPPLKEKNDTEQPRTMRERMEEHRANPACAGCHKIMDPLGLALEHFDAVGAWRSRDGIAVVDASSELADGTPVDGAAALRQSLLRRPEIFVGTLAEKLLTYGLGRGLDYHDMPAVRALVRGASRHDYRFSSLVLGIVNSTPFQMRRVQDSAN